jgi:hypothetical protein
MSSQRSPKIPIWFRKAFLGGALAVLWIFFGGTGDLFAQKSLSKSSPKTEAAGELSWEIPGRVSIYDLQFGPAVFKNNEWNFVDNIRAMDAGKFADRLTLMVRFSYKGSKSEIPLKFIIRLPGARQYEETVQLPRYEGQYSYKFTIHNPEDFVGAGSVYLYYGFSMVDVLDFTIVPGA